MPDNLTSNVPTNPKLTPAQRNVLRLSDNSRSLYDGSMTPQGDRWASRHRTIESLQARGFLTGDELTEKGRAAVNYYRERSIP